jgi:hypothetical protein
MDYHSDIDYMVVLKEDGSVPQTYLDRIKRFAERYYNRSEIKQSNPSGNDNRKLTTCDHRILTTPGG